MLQYNPVMAAKYAAMTRAAGAAADAAQAAVRSPARDRGGQCGGRRGPRASPKARVACAASLLRWIYSMVVHDTSRDAAVASGAPAGRYTPACSRRQPDQRFSGTRQGAHDLPHR